MTKLKGLVIGAHGNKYGMELGTQFLSFRGHDHELTGEFFGVVAQLKPDWVWLNACQTAAESAPGEANFFVSVAG